MIDHNLKTMAFIVYCALFWFCIASATSEFVLADDRQVSNLTAYFFMSEVVPSVDKEGEYLWYHWISTHPGLFVTKTSNTSAEQLVMPFAAFGPAVLYFPEGFVGSYQNSTYSPSNATMYYRAWFYSIAFYMFTYAESPNGLDWYNYEPMPSWVEVAPIIVPLYNLTCWEPLDASIIYTANATNTGTDWSYRMYLTIACPYGNDYEERVKEVYTMSPPYVVVVGFSADGRHWQGYDPTGGGGSSQWALPIFTPRVNTTHFDNCSILSVSVIRNSATNWEMFYGGGFCDSEHNTIFDLPMYGGIGYATSEDGFNWTRQATPVFRRNESEEIGWWRRHGITSPTVMKMGTTNYTIWAMGLPPTNMTASEEVASMYVLGYIKLVRTTLPRPPWKLSIPEIIIIISTFAFLLVTLIMIGVMACMISDNTTKKHRY